jgi:hypothetical protein
MIRGQASFRSEKKEEPEPSVSDATAAKESWLPIKDQRGSNNRGILATDTLVRKFVTMASAEDRKTLFVDERQFLCHESMLLFKLARLEVDGICRLPVLFDESRGYDGNGKPVAVLTMTRMPGAADGSWTFPSQAVFFEAMLQVLEIIVKARRAFGVRISDNNTGNWLWEEQDRKMYRVDAGSFKLSGKNKDDDRQFAREISQLLTFGWCDMSYNFGGDKWYENDRLPDLFPDETDPLTRDFRALVFSDRILEYQRAALYDKATHAECGRPAKEKMAQELYEALARTELTQDFVDAKWWNLNADQLMAFIVEKNGKSDAPVVHHSEVRPEALYKVLSQLAGRFPLEDESQYFA